MEPRQERLSGLQGVLLASRPAFLRFLKARSPEEAEDLLHELWIQAAAVAPETVEQPLAYLYRMADNLVTSRARSESRRKGRERAWTMMNDAAATPSDVDSAERALIAREQISSIEAVLAALGERTETIFRRFRLDGATQAQIARELGISLSTVEKHLQRAYRALVDYRNGPDA